MDIPLDALRSALRRSPRFLLVVGQLEEVRAISSEREVRVADFADAAALEGGYDLIVWRPRAAFNDAMLTRAEELLGPRGRLWMGISPGLRQRLMLELHRRGWAVLEEFPFHDAHWIKARHDGYVVRASQPADTDDILGLFARSFHNERSLEHWEWKYRKNPWGQDLITIARSAEGELAAHYAGYPVPFWNDEAKEALLGLQIGDTMTDPRFRRAGRGVTSLLGRCFRHFFARNCDEQVAFNYGFNTGKIRRFNFQFIKGKLAHKVTYRRRDAAAPGGGGYRVAPVSELDRSFDLFFEKVAPTYGFLVRRDASWLSWRYLECPDDPPFRIYAAFRRKRLVAWSVFRRRGDQLTWADALADPKHAAAADDLLRAGLAGAGAGIREVVAWFPQHPEHWSSALEGLGFEIVPEPDDLGLIFLPFGRSDSAQLLSRCYYTLGDGDLV
ncbi:MAG: GNAT family N-acetyltransferase [Acidobacteriota bacterium]